MCCKASIKQWWRRFWWFILLQPVPVHQSNTRDNSTGFNVFQHFSQHFWQSFISIWCVCSEKRYVFLCVMYVLLQRARMAGWLATLTWVRVPIPTLKCKCSPYQSILSFTNMFGSHDKTEEMLKFKIVFCWSEIQKRNNMPKCVKKGVFWFCMWGVYFLTILDDVFAVCSL